MIVLFVNYIDNSTNSTLVILNFDDTKTFIKLNLDVDFLPRLFRQFFNVFNLHFMTLTFKIVTLTSKVFIVCHDKNKFSNKCEVLKTSFVRL